MKRLVLPATVVAMLISALTVGQACSVPVFRYALERWQPGVYQVVIFHEGKLSDDQREAVAGLRAAGRNTKKTGINFVIEEPVNLSGKISKKMAALWSAVDARERKTTPLMVVRYPLESGIAKPFWTAPLTKQNARAFMQSPARRALTDLIIKGDTAVWVMVDSGNKKRDDKVHQLLQSEFRKFEKKRNLPKELPGVFASSVGLGATVHGQGQFLALMNLGVSGNNAMVTDLVDRLNGPVLPLRIRFSVMRIERNDSRESFFRAMLLHSEKDLVGSNEPVVFPVFGRGRSRFALVGKGINADNVGGDAAFLTGPCTCTVKNDNPGFDLMLAADWDSAVGTSLIKEKELPPLIGVGGLPLPKIRDLDPPEKKKKAPATKKRIEKTPQSAALESRHMGVWQSTLRDLANQLHSANECRASRPLNVTRATLRVPQIRIPKVASGIHLMAKIDRRSSSWDSLPREKLLEQLQVASKQDHPRALHLYQKQQELFRHAKAKDNAPDSTSGKTSEPAPGGSTSAKTTGKPIDDNICALTGLSYDLLRNTAIAILIGAVVVSAVYFFARRASQTA